MITVLALHHVICLQCCYNQNNISSNEAPTDTAASSLESNKLYKSLNCIILLQWRPLAVLLFPADPSHLQLLAPELCFPRHPLHCFRWDSLDQNPTTPVALPLEKYRNYTTTVGKCVTKTTSCKNKLSYYITNVPWYDQLTITMIS